MHKNDPKAPFDFNFHHQDQMYQPINVNMTHMKHLTLTPTMWFRYTWYWYLCLGSQKVFERLFETVQVPSAAHYKPHLIGLVLPVNISQGYDNYHPVAPIVVILFN